MLADALHGVNSQVTPDEVTFEVVVVDNDFNRSAASVVKTFKEKTDLTIIYDCEPEQNISLARNRAVSNASGKFIAFIDDDEIPVRDWLLRLYCVMKESNADGVLGPVYPSYPAGAPDWLKRGNILGTRHLPSGTRLSVRDTRTGNVLMSRAIMDEEGIRFDPAFGRTGGEDVDFFERQIVRGRVFVWCDEAVVYEKVPAERWRAVFHLEKWLRMGTLNGERIRRSGAAGRMVLVKRVISVPVWLVGFLLTLPFGKHVWIRPAMKLAYSSGCVLAYLGLIDAEHRKEVRK